MYPRLRPLQRGQTKPFGHRCAVRCSPHWTSSPKRERNSLTVMMGFLFNRLGFFISDIISSFVRLFKLDIHLKLIPAYLFGAQLVGRLMEVAGEVGDRPSIGTDGLCAVVASRSSSCMRWRSSVIDTSFQVSMNSTQSIRCTPLPR